MSAPQSPFETDGRPVRSGLVLPESIETGLVAASVVVAALLIRDASIGEPLHTPSVLGSLLFQGVEAARREVQNRSGTWFDPELVEAFGRVADDAGFWTALAAPELSTAIQNLEPAQEVRTVDEDYLDDVAAAFAKVIDSKSPYTSGHSERVTLFTDLVAEEMGFLPETRRAAARHRQARRQQHRSRQARQARRRRMGGDQAAFAVFRADFIAHRGLQRSCHRRRRASRTARRQGLSARSVGRSDRARNAHHHGRGYFRRADRRAAVSGGDADFKSLRDHGGRSRHRD